MMLNCRLRALVAMNCALWTAAPVAAQGAFARNFPWAAQSDQFEPSYLVVCTPSQSTVACPIDGMALLPDPPAYTNLTLRMLGGPFTQRWQVENMRAALVRQGMPTHSLYVFVVNSGGQTIGGFWLGARPTCSDLHSRGPLSGEVSADLAPTGARPDAMPVSEDAFSAYIAYVDQIRPTCQERLQGGQASTIPQRGPDE